MVEFPRQKNFKAQLTSTQVRYTGENQQIPKKKNPKKPKRQCNGQFCDI